MKKLAEKLCVGTVLSTHGIRGEVKVYPTTDEPERFRRLKTCIIELDGTERELTIESVKFFKQFVILKFREWNDINEVQAAHVLKKDIYVKREDAIPLKPGEYYICDLIHATVVTDEDITLGTLTDVMHTGANDVYEVTMTDGKKLLLPATKECILKIDVDAERIDVHLLPGLLDL